MFNPLSAPEITLAVGRVLKEAASATDLRDDYQRAQLLSAYSITRHLAAEQAAGDELIRWFRREVAAELERASGEDRSLAELEGQAAAIGAGRDGAELGERISELLAILRRSGSPEAGRLTGRVRHLLHDLCDREVAALSATGG
jgi:hypothetical protein